MITLGNLSNQSNSFARDVFESVVNSASSHPRISYSILQDKIVNYALVFIDEYHLVLFKARLRRLFDKNSRYNSRF